MGIKTDSTPVEDPKDPERCNVFALLRLMAEPEEADDWEQRYRQGGTGYGQAKQRLFELVLEVLGLARKRYEELAAHPDQVERVLADGAQRARAVAAGTMRDVRKACGLATVRD